MERIKDISFYIVITTALTLLSYWSQSTFLFEYLRSNLIGLLITLLAINTATTGLIASKMQDMISNKSVIDFRAPIREMKISLTEQIILISMSIVILILFNSQLIKFTYKEVILNSCLVFVLVYSLAILLDTGRAVFVLIDGIQDNKKDKRY